MAEFRSVRESLGAFGGVSEHLGEFQRVRNMHYLRFETVDYTDSMENMDIFSEVPMQSMALTCLYRQIKIVDHKDYIENVNFLSTASTVSI